MRRAVRRAAGLAAALTLIGAAAAGAAPTAGLPTADAPVAAPVAAGTPMFPLFGRKSNGRLYGYEPKGTGGVKPAVDLGGGYAEATAIVQANVSENGAGNDLYFRMGTKLYYAAERGGDTKLIGGGWDIYNLLLSVGDLGGTTHPDLVARDAAGALWLYQGRADGSLAARIKIGTSGWNGMDQLAGRGDFTGDGKADLLARSTTGTLYIYPGTGNAAEGAALGSRITVGTGWDAYKTLVSSGDNDGDGKADLIAADAAGLLWLFKGTGSATTPFAARVQIGTSGWAAFNTLF
ncbi:FG-GAP-like repeat-containing protein [Streptomyces sp. NPDC056237]|uniref:FG-GAP-like repeat-containing protein n=1 Tax=unclassified Streptomyces TaxID=2593676 RepID=UPI0035E14091